MERETPIDEKEYDHFVRRRRLVGITSSTSLDLLLEISSALKRLQKRCGKFLEDYSKTGELE
jgi:hypothetical protein